MSARMRRPGEVCLYLSPWCGNLHALAATQCGHALSDARDNFLVASTVSVGRARIR